MITIKTKEEIEILREGGKRHAAILRELVSMVKPGITTAELDKQAAKLVADGNDKPAFLNYKPYGAKRPYPASLCVSINDEVVHGIPTDEKVIKEGDIVSIDLGLVHKGLFTDMAVTVPAGKVSPELEKLMKITKEALNAGIGAVKAGKRIGDVGSAIEKIGLKNKYGIVRELSGHGVGYSVHEEPYVPNYGIAGKGELLKAGIVIAIEPMFNLGTQNVVLGVDGYTYRTADNKASAHFEHTVLVTEDGAEILTQV